jgi:AbrB family transcriptional regulator, transcriptional pleiotropic regulator of transition state genes
MKMKATGIVRKVDDLGRIVIPKEIRRTQGINEYDPMEIFVDDHGIYLRPFQSDVSKKSTLEWLDQAMANATNKSDRESISAAISYVKQA